MEEKERNVKISTHNLVKPYRTGDQELSHEEQKKYAEDKINGVVPQPVKTKKNKKKEKAEEEKTEDIKDPELEGIIKNGTAKKDK